MTTEQTIYKINDVFKFRYKEAVAKKMFEPYHCFDGTLVVKEHESSGLILLDTYWGGNDSKSFTIEEAEKQGDLTFICNLYEVEDVNGRHHQYYNPADFFEIRIHHGYRNKFYIKKGATRSQAIMLESINEVIENTQREIKSLEHRLQWQEETKKKIESGDTSVYI